MEINPTMTLSYTLILRSCVFYYYFLFRRVNLSVFYFILWYNILEQYLSCGDILHYSTMWHVMSHLYILMKSIINEIFFINDAVLIADLTFLIIIFKF